MTIDDDKVTRIRKSLSAGSTPKAPRKAARPAVKIKGDHNIVGDGNVIHIYKRTTQKAKPAVKTGDGVITPPKKAI